MATINISKSLRKRLKQQALSMDVTLSAWAEEVLEDATPYQREPGKKTSKKTKPAKQ